VKETDVGVEVHSGVVTLTGTVASWAARIAAADAAHRVVSVMDVANNIEVTLPGSAAGQDTDVAKAVRSALQWEVLVPDEQIRTTVSRGVVTLEGNVDHQKQSDEAARAIRNLYGVTHVNNQISIALSSERLSQEELQRAIAETLAGHAEYTARHVSVAVSEGTVTLSGDVRSRAERQTIEDAVRATPGVRTLTNNLRIEIN
jgi:osmotically-inducible protein OsmY